MQIIFIHHSCFLVELDDKVLIFDYFDGDKVEGVQAEESFPAMWSFRPMTLTIMPFRLPKSRTMRLFMIRR